MDEQKEEPKKEDVQTPSSTPSSTPSTTTPVDKSQNTLMAVLCYLGILVLVPLLTEYKKEPFVKFHIKQGLVLLITEVIVSVASVIITNIIPFIFFFSWAAYLLVLVLLIIGIMNAASGKQQPLPVIGSFADKINI